DAHTRFQIDPLRPPAQQSVAGRIGDSINLAAGAAVRLAGYKAVPAGVAYLVHVVKRDHVSFAERLTGCIAIDPATLEHSTNTHVTRDDGVRHAGQTAVLQVDIRAAHFAGDG